MCAAVHEEILEARCQGYTNLYLNYRKLSELPEELLTLSKTKKLYLKRNILTKLVRGTDCFRTDYRFTWITSLLISCTFIL